MSDPAPEQNADDTADSASERPPWLLFAGALIGLALAAFGLLEPKTGPQTLSGDTAARVGERRIRRIDYQRVLAGVEGDLRNPLDDAIRRRVLDRMIDEELLVQRALELGLAAIDRRVRGELTSGLMDSIVAEADASEASEREVVRHFEENLDFFTRPGRLHARTIFFSARSDRHRKEGRALQRALRVRELLRPEEGASDLESRFGDPQISPLPDGMLPPSKVRDYVGPIILQTLESLAVGEWSQPIESGGGVYLVRVIERESPNIPAFEDVAGLVRQDLKRRRGEQALRDYLDDLRNRTSVAINESVFSAENQASTEESSRSFR